jgi:hypothetical protein
MLVLLDGERLEAALPKVAARSVMAMIAAHIRVAEPLHPVAQIAVLVRPQH